MRKERSWISWRAVLLTGICAAVAACAAFVADADRTPPDSDPLARDAAADVEDAETRDSASTSEAAPSGSFCTTLNPAPTFCDDFDDRGPRGWDAPPLVVDDVFLSEPNSCLIAEGTSDAAIRPTRNFNLFADKVRASFDVLVGNSAQSDDVRLVKLSFFSGLNVHTIGLGMIGLNSVGGVTPRLFVEVKNLDAGAVEENVPLPEQSLAEWKHVAIEVSFSRGADGGLMTATVSMTLGGPETAKEVQVTLPESERPLRVRLTLGFDGADVGSLWKGNLDNIVFDNVP